MLQLSGELYGSSPEGFSSMKYLQMCTAHVVNLLSLFVPLEGKDGTNKQGWGQDAKRIAGNGLAFQYQQHTHFPLSYGSSFISSYYSTLCVMKHIFELVLHPFSFLSRKCNPLLSEIKHAYGTT